MTHNEIKRGDIYYISCVPVIGSEQRGGRPGIIVSNDVGNKYSDTVEIVYLTTRPKKPMPTHFTVLATDRKSVALCEQVSTVDKSRIGTYVGSLNAKEMALLNKALVESLALRPVHTAKKRPQSAQKTQ